MRGRGCFGLFVEQLTPQQQIVISWPQLQLLVRWLFYITALNSYLGRVLLLLSTNPHRQLRHLCFCQFANKKQTNS
ncbi:uncharacterized protein LAJ45_09443 [Morchella importuna]|uniref:uncharacterized protein n=1 Tax=Morchella importuna TaxID=1174673 RepID=UPI001E8DE174|nr:uncharacterized protein LAJ45_09443 [Morchella importuna]KAH8146497.1 hypothetical protein LAJ45_09443 [Morchella importuna]